MIICMAAERKLAHVLPSTPTGFDLFDASKSLFPMGSVAHLCARRARSLHITRISILYSMEIVLARSVDFNNCAFYYIDVCLSVGRLNNINSIYRYLDVMY